MAIEKDESFDRIYALSQKGRCVATANGEVIASQGWMPVGCEPPIEEYMARSMFHSIEATDPFQKVWQMPTITQILGKEPYYPSDPEDDNCWMFNDMQSSQSRASYNQELIEE